jgi:hypothetical protein
VGAVDTFIVPVALIVSIVIYLCTLTRKEELTMITKLIIEKSKRGLPVAWEQGGSYSNTGNATIITDEFGKPQHSIYVRRSGSLACEKHALIPIKLGSVIISASHHREDFTVNIYRVVDFTTEEHYETATLEVIDTFDKGEWNKEDSPGVFSDAVRVVKKKALTYHCRVPMYITNNQ